MRYFTILKDHTTVMLFSKFRALLVNNFTRLHKSSDYDPSYFTRMFKKNTGLSPTDFRKEIQKKHL